MGCLFALLAALSSFTVVLMPCGNLSHDGGCSVDFFFSPLLGKQNKAGVNESPVVYCTLFECKVA